MSSALSSGSMPLGVYLSMGTASTFMRAQSSHRVKSITAGSALLAALIISSFATLSSLSAVHPSLVITVVVVPLAFVLSVSNLVCLGIPRSLSALFMPDVTSSSRFLELPVLWVLVEGGGRVSYHY